MVTAVKKLFALLLACCVIIICSSNKKHPSVITATGKVTLHFINTVKNTPLVLDSAAYTNPFGET